MKTRAIAAASFAALSLLASGGAHAALFEDDEARRAILELRQRADAQRLASDRQAQDTEQLRRVMQGYRDLLARIDGQVGGGRPSMATADSSRPVVNSEPTDRAAVDGDTREADTETR